MNRNDGYTLVELLLYCAVIGTLLMVSVGFFMTMNATRSKGQTISEVEQQGSAAIKQITQLVRNSTSIESPFPNTSASGMSVTTTSSETSPTLIQLDGSKLTIKEGEDPPISLTNDNVHVTQFRVKNLSLASTPGVVRIELTIRHDNPQGRQEFDYEQTFTTSAARRE